MKRYEQWRANPSSVQVQSQLPPAPNSNPQPLAPRRSIQSHGTNTPSSSSTCSSSRSRRSVPPRSHTPSPYDQTSHEEDMVILRDAPRRRDETYPADGAQMYAREDDMRRRRECALSPNHPTTHKPAVPCRHSSFWSSFLQVSLARYLFPSSRPPFASITLTSESFTSTSPAPYLPASTPFGRFSDRDRNRDQGRDREHRDGRSLYLDRDRAYCDRSHSWDRKYDRERP